MIHRPTADEHSEYFGRYINLVPETDLIPLMENQIGEDENWLRKNFSTKLGYAYAEGKWSVEQVFLHLIDTERVMTYRALTFARGGVQPLPGFDQDVFAKHAETGKRSFQNILDEYKNVRKSSVDFFKNLSEEASKRSGIASGNANSVRALAYVIAGHHIHHMGVLRAKYLQSFK